MRGNSIPKLSKSRFLAGLQCPLRLWYQAYHPELASEINSAQQAVFDQGHQVGELATRLYPGGHLIEEDHLHHEEAVRNTLKSLTDLKVKAIYEAAFLCDDVRCRVDVLERLRDGRWHLIEVKSTTSVKDVHLPDLAIQYYVLRASGLDISMAGLIHVNNQYVYDGKEIELKPLFSQTDMTKATLAQQAFISERLKELKAMLGKRDQPNIKPSRHCKRPYDCEFWEHCTREMPHHWIMELTGISQCRFQELTAMGIESISDIPDSFPLTMIQQRIRQSVIQGEAYVSEELEYELRDVVFPVHFLDFETVSPAIPRYTGTRPYQAMPFQLSDHILDEQGNLTHREYLCTEDRDPRETFSETLMDCLGERGSIFVYTNYEKEVIKGLMDQFPQFQASFMPTLERFKDLHAIIRKHFYHPEFHGSFSLKSVLPALVPDMSYKGLNIQEGSEASLEFLRLIDPVTPKEEKKKIRQNLLDYCGHDTLAMVRIREALLGRF
jgi:predicted RecB family nuclease